MDQSSEAERSVFNQAQNAIQSDDIAHIRGLLESADRFELLRTSELLFAALELARTRIALELIDNNINLNSMDDDGTNCLMIAAKKNNQPALEKIIDSRQVEVDGTDYFGWSALMYSCYYGHHEVARRLLLAGAHADLADLDHMSSLIWASGRGHPECVGTLLQLGKAKVNQADKCGTSPLIWACRRGHAQVAAILLKNGANVDSIGVFGWSALLVSVHGNHLETMKLLLQQKPNVNTCDGQRHTPLIAASKEGKLEMVKLLLKARAFVNLSDEHGHTALIHAAKGGHLEVVDLLLKQHANIEHAGPDKKSALFWAVEKGHSSVVERLLQAKANPEAASKEGDTCVMKAVKLRRVSLVRSLLAHQAKAAASDKNGDTILHMATRMQSATIAQIILANPKNHHLLHRTNKAKKTPIVLDLENSSPIFPALLAMCNSAANKSSQLRPQRHSRSNGSSSIHLDCLQPDSLGASSLDEENQARSLLVKKLASVLDQRLPMQTHELV